jgi:hypothetical protein
MCVVTGVHYSRDWQLPIFLPTYLRTTNTFLLFTYLQTYVPWVANEFVLETTKKIFKKNFESYNNRSKYYLF